MLRAWLTRAQIHDQGAAPAVPVRVRELESAVPKHIAGVRRRHSIYCMMSPVVTYKYPAASRSPKMSLLSGTAQAAHSAVTSLLSVAQIQPGHTIPSQTVKEDSADRSFPLTLKGRNIIARCPCPAGPALTPRRSASLARSPAHAARRSQHTSTATPSSRQRASTRSSSSPSTTCSSSSEPPAVPLRSR